MSIDPDMIHKDKRDLELADGLYGQLRCNHNVTKFESKILSICSLLHLYRIVSLLVVLTVSNLMLRIFFVDSDVYVVGKSET